jgi:Fic family protein
VPVGPLDALSAHPRVVAAVAAARDALDRASGHRVLRRRSAEVSAEAALHSARASAALSGARYDLADLRDGRVPDDPALQGALRAAAATGALVDVLDRSPLHVLARLHLLVAADAVVADQLGRPRRPGEQVLDAPGAPADPSVVAGRLADLGALLSARARPPALALAAVAHAEVLALQPFTWGNGLVARALQRVILVGRGLDPKALSAPDVGHLELQDEYAALAAGYAGGSPDAVVAWVEHCARAVTLGGRETVAICEAMQRA